MIIGGGYQKFLAKHMFGLACGGTCNYMTAKYFQIPALRSMLVCSDTNGLDLFPEETYIKYSADNVEKLCADVEYYIRNKREAKEKAAVLTNHVLKNHNHRVRAEQLMSFIRSKA
jgi:spore maturation protein CgeB